MVTFWRLPHLKYCNQSFKETAYIALVRSVLVLEYSWTVWDPHYKEDITQLEKIQWKAARFVKGDYGRYSSVTQMMNDLNGKPDEHFAYKAHIIVIDQKLQTQS